MDKYTILLRIGEGAHGVVYKAKHIESGEVVALKKVYSPVLVLIMLSKNQLLSDFAALNAKYAMIGFSMPACAPQIVYV